VVKAVFPLMRINLSKESLAHRGSVVKCFVAE
jgi:hypothetical protein